MDTTQFPPALPAWLDLALGDSFFAQLQGAPSQLSSTTFNPTADFIQVPQAAGQPLNLWTCAWDNMALSNGLVGCNLVQTKVPLGIRVGTLISNGEVLSQNCYSDSEDAYIAFSGAPPSASTSWLSQVLITPSSTASLVSQQVQVETTTTLGCGVQSCAACPDCEVQSLYDEVQTCTVINCIGTPINMRRVICRLGQTFADEARESQSVLYGGWVVFVDMFMLQMELSLRKGLLGITVSFPDDAFFGYVCTAKDQSAHLISIFTRPSTTPCRSPTRRCSTCRGVRRRSTATSAPRSPCPSRRPPASCTT